jgi:nucleoside-diphosphate-sugar epimerase
VSLEEPEERPHRAPGPLQVLNLLEPGLGLSREDRELLAGNVDRVIHCAASISFDSSLKQARAINVGGVARVIELAREIAAGGGLRRLVHVSTAYVSGRHSGLFGEEDLDVAHEFRNTYERSKNEAEHLLRDVTDLSIVIARPSMIVGHQASGWTPAFNVIYWPIRAFERGLLKVIPARADSLVDFTPVDYVARAIIALADSDDASGTYNIVAGDRALRADRLLELLSGDPGASLGAPVQLRALRPGEQLPLGADTLLPYFDVRARFSDERARGLLAAAGIERPEPEAYLPELLSFARRTAWGKRPMTREAALQRADRTDKR